MIIPTLEKPVLGLVGKVGGVRARKIAEKVISKAQKDGVSVTQEARMLGKKALVVGSVVAAGLAVGAVAATATLAHAALDRYANRPGQVGPEKDIALGGSALSQLTAKGNKFYRNYGKRACDIGISIVSLPVVGAVIAGCGLAIKLEDRGPIFYNAPRVGKDGHMFIMYKLRSMKMDAPDLVMADGSTYNGADDPRMTKVGAFLRRTSLDEIPQFLNVLKGDMSVVGPRPDLQRETELYQGDEALKLKVKPGITGYAAVYGRNSLPWHDRLALDVYYVRHMSLPLDTKVFFKTFMTVCNQEGIYVQDELEAQTPQVASELPTTPTKGQLPAGQTSEEDAGQEASPQAM